MSRFKAIIFDMDGLLLDTERLGFEAWSMACDEIGINLPVEVFAEMIGKVQADSREVLINHFGYDFPYQQLRDRRLEIGKEQISNQGIPLKDGAVELLEGLSRRGVPLALATSTRKELATERLQNVNIYRFFNYFVFGDEVKKGKPNPEIFNKASEGIGHFPDDCLVFEDSIPGAQAAIAAKMSFVLVPDFQKPPENIQKKAVRVLDSLVQAPELVSECL